MDLRLAIPEQHVDADVLDAALEASTRLQEKQVAAGEVPTFRQANPGRSVVWQPEPPGAERFDHARKVIGRGWGDCDDLAPWHAASLRVTGEDPGATAVVIPSGPNRWHAIVKRSDGSIDDPSIEAGMPHASVVGDDSGNTLLVPPPPSLCVCPAVIPRMYADQRPAIAVRQNAVTGQYDARADLPWLDTEYALSALASSPVASTAIVGAIRGVCGWAHASGASHKHHRNRLAALGALLMGHSRRDVASVVGGEVVSQVEPLAVQLAGVGDFFSDLASGFKSVEPMLSKAAQFIPGVGPVVSTAMDVATQFIPSQQGAAPQQAAAAAALQHPVTQQAIKQAMQHPAVQQAMQRAGNAAIRAPGARGPAAPGARPVPRGPAPAAPVVTHPGAAAATMKPAGSTPRVVHFVPGQGGHVLMMFGDGATA